MKVKKILLNSNLGKPFIFLYRASIGTKHLFCVFKKITRWLIYSNETTNYTSNMTPLNKLYLANFLSSNLNLDLKQIISYLKEIEGDQELKKHIKLMTKKSLKKNISDPNAKYGRRIGWYAIIRATKPKIVIETGIDKGLGSCIIAVALKKNSEEGHKGYYYGTDINPLAGELFAGKYSKYGEILYGDSIESLKKLNCKIDLFINDIDHSADYEAKEYETIKSKLAKKGIILGDNSHVTNKLFNFSKENRRKFRYFREETENDLGFSAGIGMSY